MALKTVTGFPAGFAEKGEALDKTAARELEEETGYVAEKVELIGKALDSPTKQPNSKFFYLAWGCKKKADWTPKEVNELEEVSVEKIHQMLLDGSINDLGAQVAGLLAFSPYKSINYETLLP
jgi:ADP-ribose pyrophosphatase